MGRKKKVTIRTVLATKQELCIEMKYRQEKKEGGEGEKGKEEKGRGEGKREGGGGRY